VQGAAPADVSRGARRRDLVFREGRMGTKTGNGGGKSEPNLYALTKVGTPVWPGAEEAGAAAPS